MIISPPFLLETQDINSTDPVMDAVDRYEMAHGIYPIAFDRRWHPGMHLTPRMQNEKIHAIADGEVVAYRVCQYAFDGGGGVQDSNAGFVLLKHTTDTGEGRKLTFYSLYMHLLELDGYNDHGFHPDVLPSFLRTSSPGPNMQPPAVAPAQAGGGLKVYRKDILGLTGRCHGQLHLHVEIFMTKPDFDTYFGHTQLGEEQVTTPAIADYWGSSYYVIPPQQQFLPLPVGTDAHHKLNGIRFDELRAGRNADTLYAEAWFHKGSKFTKVWRGAGAGQFELLTTEPIREPDYEYNLYNRASALYPGCPSDGYEMLRFGRVFSAPATLPEAARTTWMRVAFAAGQQGYIDINNRGVLKLSDADFPFFKGWKKISEGSGPFNTDGLCDIDALKKILKDAKEHETPQEAAQTEEYQKEDVLVRYLKTTEGVREQLRGFVCEAPSEWDSTHNEDRYRKLKDPGEFYDGNEAGYRKFLNLLKSFQFWDHTGLPAGEKFWFFHPMAFIRHFRRCGWMSLDELAATFPRHTFYGQTGNPRTAITTDGATYTLTKTEACNRIREHSVALNKCIRKYIGHDKQRISIFLAQVLLETAQWRNLSGVRRLMHEWGFGQYSNNNPATEYYGAFYGRGIMQLTWAGNYMQYGKFRSFPNNVGAYTERLPSIAPRITSASRHYTGNPNDGGQLIVWFPRFDPDFVAEDVFSSCDSGGFYWVSKSFSQGFNINRVADRLYSAANIGLVNRLVNGGGNGYYERQAYSAYMLRKLTDRIGSSSIELIVAPPPKSVMCADMESPE
ncbi:peptidase M23 [Paraburkholderia sediminicola]|uniref:peptidase M23 n=1 Tax=Paraburkholderia sediminicola TaxID=458836 RepID=UPI0038BBA119